MRAHMALGGPHLDLRGAPPGIHVGLTWAPTRDLWSPTWVPTWGPRGPMWDPSGPPNANSCGPHAGLAWTPRGPPRGHQMVSHVGPMWAPISGIFGPGLQKSLKYPWMYRAPEKRGKSHSHTSFTLDRFWLLATGKLFVLVTPRWNHYRMSGCHVTMTKPCKVLQKV